MSQNENNDQNSDKIKTEEEDIFHNFYKANIIQPLKGFCATVEEGCSLTRASEKLFLTPSAIAKQIQSLEDKLHVKLFNKIDSNRVNRVALELTEDGKAFYEKAREIVERTDALIAEFSDEMNEKESNTLNIATNSYIFQKLIPVISEFKEKYQNFFINIKFLDQETSFKKLIDNEVDIFISSLENNEETSKAIDFIGLSDYTPYWVLYKGHPLENKSIEEITQEEILKNNFIFNDKNISMKSLKNFFESNKVRSAINFEDCGVEMEKTLIKNKMGIWLIFDIFLNEKDEESLVIKSAKHMFPSGKYGCFIKKHNHKKILEEFTKFLVNKKSQIFKKFSKD